MGEDNGYVFVTSGNRLGLLGVTVLVIIEKQIILEVIIHPLWFLEYATCEISSEIAGARLGLESYFDHLDVDLTCLLRYLGKASLLSCAAISLA